MRRQKSILNDGFVFCIGLFFILQGCQSYHMHRVKNVGDTNLYNVTILSQGKSFNHGVLIPQTGKSYSGSFEIDSQNCVVISWDSYETGTKKRQLLLEENPGTREVVFNIDGENVTITYHSY